MSAIIRHWNGEDEKRLDIVRACFFVDCGQEYGHLCVGWANANSINARHDYTYYHSLARLASAIGIDNTNDVRAFRTWWKENSIAVYRAYARYKGFAGVPATFAEFCSQAFLDWLEPMANDDKQAQQEYNREEVQHWLVLGLENSAVVDLDYTDLYDCSLEDEPHRITYTPGDYPTFKRFCYIAWVNKEIEKWTNFIPRS